MALVVYSTSRASIAAPLLSLDDASMAVACNVDVQESRPERSVKDSESRSDPAGVGHPPRRGPRP